MVAIRVEDATIARLDKSAGVKTDRIVSEGDAQHLGYFDGPPYGVAVSVARRLRSRGLLADSGRRLSRPPVGRPRGVTRKAPRRTPFR